MFFWAVLAKIWRLFLATLAGLFRSADCYNQRDQIGRFSFPFGLLFQTPAPHFLADFVQNEKFGALLLTQISSIN